MATFDEQLAYSLSADTPALIPFLPYLLQDLWELGSSPDDIATLIARHVPLHPGTKVLDLACGKGAVAVRIAKQFGVSVRGIDGMAAFIKDANKKATEHGVATLCEFLVDDIHRRVTMERSYDIVVLGAVGSVLGEPKTTLDRLATTIRPGGYIVLDDGYAKHPDQFPLLTRQGWLDLLETGGFQLLEDIPITNKELARICDLQLSVIAKRAEELCDLHPDQAPMFRHYLHLQQQECAELSSTIQGVTMMIRRNL